MAVSDWVRQVVERVREDGLRSGVSHGFTEFSISVSRRLGNFGLYSGQNIYDREWDVLVLLDGCRVDLISEVRDEYSFLDSLDTHVSPASMSRTWMEATFTEAYAEEMANTVHVTANPYSNESLDPSAFALLDEVWRDCWDDDVGTVRPREVTNRAICAGRQERWNHLIVHYMQPHWPFVRNPIGDRISIDSFGTGTTNVWDLLQEGVAEKSDAWEAYRGNLELVLDDVELLLNNVDAETVVLSADHGNAFGEFGIYGHPEGVALESIRRVPFATTSATDRETHVPDPVGEADKASNASVENRLSALGYKEE